MLPILWLIISSGACKAGCRNISTSNSSRSTQLAGGCFRVIRKLTLFTGETLIRIVGRIPSSTNSFTIAKSSIEDNAFCIVTSCSTGFKGIQAGCRDSGKGNNGESNEDYVNEHCSGSCVSGNCEHFSSEKMINGLNSAWNIDKYWLTKINWQYQLTNITWQILIDEYGLMNMDWWIWIVEYGLMNMDWWIWIDEYWLMNMDWWILTASLSFNMARSIVIMVTILG